MNKNLRWPNKEVEVKSLKSVIEWLKPLCVAVETKNEIAAIEILLNEIGKCHTCLGTGENIGPYKPESNYKVRFYPRGQTGYITPCASCKGLGKILEITCVSCGIVADRQFSQKHLTYCSECEARFVLNGQLK